jgi:hypothetical protein
MFFYLYYIIYCIKNKTKIKIASESEYTLYTERLKEYQELAKLYDESYRDTVEDAEKNNGVIEGGTWEHRKRGKEMLETAKKSLLLTIKSSGRHISDYLPKDILNTFLKNAESLKESKKLTINFSLPLNEEFDTIKVFN